MPLYWNLSMLVLLMILVMMFKLYFLGNEKIILNNFYLKCEYNWLW